MKKTPFRKITILLVAAIMLLTALSGCAFPRQNPDDWREKMAEMNSDNTSTESSAEDISEDNSDETSESENDYLDKLSGKKSDEYEDVIDISSIGEGYTGVNQIEFINESELLIVFFDDAEYTVCIYNIFDGSNEILAKSDISDYIKVYPDYSAVEYKEDKIAFYTNIKTKNEPYIFNGYDEKLNVVSFSGMLTYIKSQSVYTYNTKTSETSELFQLPMETSNYDVVSSGDFLYVNGYNYNELNESEIEFCVVYSLSESKLKTIENTVGTLAVQGGSLSVFSMIESNTRVYCVDALNTYAANLTFLKSEKEEPIGANGKYFITRQGTPECIVRVYGKTENKCVSEFRFKNEGNPKFAHAALSKDKRLLAIPVYKDSDSDDVWDFKLYLIPLDGREPPEGSYEVSYDNLSEQAKRAYELGDEYGLTINLYEEASFDYYPYSPQTLLNNDMIKLGLNCLENVLEKYPEGFFEELCSTVYSEMEINITGEIKALDEDEAIDARAYFYVDSQDRYIIVANCSYTYFLEQTFAHELMHAMDSFICDKLSDVENEGYPDWYDYLPHNFEYNNDYFDEAGEFYDDIKYVFNDSKNLTNVYFLETYQKTYAIEDRAVMFEYLFVTGSGFIDEMAIMGLDSRFESEKITDRAIYMCSVIRECFATVQATEQTQWEKALGITADDLDEYIKKTNNAA